MSSLTIAEIVAGLGAIAPFDKAASWDPVGLQFGDPAAVVERIAVCHEVTEQVLSRLEDDPVDLLVAYHPLLFEPTRRLVAGPSAAGRAFRLIRLGVALGVVHTAFDVVPGGASDALAAALGLSDTVGFGPLWNQGTSKVIVFVPRDDVERVAAGMAEAGGGRIGNYSSCSFRSEGTGVFFGGAGSTPAVGSAGELDSAPEVRLEMVAPESRVDAVVAALAGSHPYEEPAFDVVPMRGNSGFVGRIGSLPAPESLDDFAAFVGSKLNGVVRVSRGGADPVSTVAVVPGSGSSFIGHAGSRADVIVTGDVAHHAARAATDRGISIVDPGHGATEQPGVAALYAAVSALGPATTHLLPEDHGPWEEPA